LRAPRLPTSSSRLISTGWITFNNTISFSHQHARTCSETGSSSSHPQKPDLKFDIKPGFDLAGALKGGHLAMADPDSVPAGKYGKAALEKLGVWSSVRAAVAPAENVRAALLFVSRGEAPLGIVYATDAAADPRVKIAGVFPEDTHPPIIYPAALTAYSKNPNAARLLEFLTSPAVRPIFEKRGFTVLQ
jgi:molybdate transport system substrate-binding protein